MMTLLDDDVCHGSMDQWINGGVPPELPKALLTRSCSFKACYPASREHVGSGKSPQSPPQTPHCAGPGRGKAQT